MAENENIAALLRSEFAKQATIFKEELAKVKEQIRQLGVETNARLETCEERISKIENEILDIKRKSLKNNIIVSGLDVNNTDLTSCVISKLNTLLDLNLQVTEVNNIYKLGKNKPVIKIEFLSYLTKNKVTQNRHKLKGSRIYLNEDLCEEDRDDFKYLRRQLNSARSNKHRAYISQKFLVVDGEKFSVDQLRKQTEFGSDLEQEHEIVKSTPKNPTLIGSLKQKITVHDYLSLDSKDNPESLVLKPVQEKAKDWEERSRTRSQSSGSGKTRAQKTGNTGSKAKKGG